MDEKYSLISVSNKETDFLYSTENPVKNEEIGCIGRLRGDFGQNGEEFWSTWLDFCHELNTKILGEELDGFINSLRDNGILKNRAAMAAYCAGNLQAKLSDTRCDNFGFKAKANKHIFYLRCIPLQRDYSFYCYVYERSIFEKCFPALCW